MSSAERIAPSDASGEISPIVEGSKPKERSSSSHPELIQGGMGVGVSGWELARSVAIAGEKLGKRVLGTVSGVGLSAICAEKLGRGDEDTMRALQAFPVPEIAQELKGRYWLRKNRLFQSILPPKPEVLINGSKESKDLLTKLLVFSNYAEVFLAKQGHKGPISINYLEKVQPGRLFELYGAMLAGVDYVAMGAGLPHQTPGILDRFAAGQSASYKIDVTGSEGEGYDMVFNPATIFGDHFLKRPNFLGIVSLLLAAKVIMKKTEGEICGFVVESPIAGGHNAPPRKRGEDNGDIPVYGPKDMPDLDGFRNLGLPFWKAGGMASPVAFQNAITEGAAGVQIGSAFALSDESGMREDHKRELISRGFGETLIVTPSMKTSPTGFPFNVAQLSDSLSNPDIFNGRERECNYGFLREFYKTPEGKVRSRCPAEDISTFVKNGGKKEDAEIARCLCAGLGATVDMAPGSYYIVTLGSKLDFLEKGRMINSPEGSYKAEDVTRFVFSNSE